VSKTRKTLKTLKTPKKAKKGGVSGGGPEGGGGGLCTHGRDSVKRSNLDGTENRKHQIFDTNWHPKTGSGGGGGRGGCHFRVFTLFFTLFTQIPLFTTWQLLVQFHFIPFLSWIITFDTAIMNFWLMYQSCK
jgi:hypothetical protein